MHGNPVRRQVTKIIILLEILDSINLLYYLVMWFIFRPIRFSYILEKPGNEVGNRLFDNFRKESCKKKPQPLLFHYH